MESEELLQYRAIAYNAIRYGTDGDAIKAERLLRELEGVPSLPTAAEVERSIKRIQFTAWTIMRDREPVYLVPRMPQSRSHLNWHKISPGGSMVFDPPPARRPAPPKTGHDDEL